MTVSPIDVGITPELCIAFDPGDEHGIWWWEPGANGCASRSTGPTVFQAEGTFTGSGAGQTVVVFRLGTHSWTRPFVDVRLAIDKDMLRSLETDARVKLERRTDLNVPERVSGLVETTLYGALLKERFHAVPGSRMVVKDTAIAMRPFQSSNADWLKQFDEVPDELRRRARDQPAALPRHLDASLFPEGTRLASADKLESFMAGSEDSPEFRATFNASGWVAVSDPLVTADRLNALVYYESRCGGLCGEGGYAWLNRAARTAPWRVKRVVVDWIS